MDIGSKLLQVEFGSIDGMNDPNLEKYFFDDNYWDSIVENKMFFVIGRKGTGKSAIYNWIKIQGTKGGHLVNNLSFKEFPFEKLLQLTDDDYSTPNQYQSIWRNIILSELARQIVTDEKAIHNDIFNSLSEHVKYTFGKDVLDVHTVVTRMAKKFTDTIKIPTLPILKSGYEHKEERSRDIELDKRYENVTMLNRKLEDMILDYLKIYPHNTKFIVQFDQLDDNYTTFINKEKYFQSIISLFKVIYSLNQSFLRLQLPALIIAYLRSDIFYRIDQYDAESARWDEHKYDLYWTVKTTNDYSFGKLRKMINQRIRSSISIKSNDPWSEIFDNEQISLKVGNDFKYDVFKYIVNRTFHRPRDVVQFCKKIQKKCEETGILNFRTIRDAENEYSLWLLQEIKNEIGNEVKNMDALYDFLRRVGSRPTSISRFKSIYNSYKDDVGLNDNKILKMLYLNGIVLNVQYLKREKRFYSVLRNDRSNLNPDLEIEIHKGLWKGIHVSTYM